MGTTDRDIILDEEAFETAIKDFENLEKQLQKLRTDIEDMLKDLQAGFDTPAGVKFINACETNIFQPLDDQKLVLEHISKTLSESKQTYNSVFQKYEALQQMINKVNNE